MPTIPPGQHWFLIRVNRLVSHFSQRRRISPPSYTYVYILHSISKGGMPFFTKFATIFPLSSLCNETTLGRGAEMEGSRWQISERTNESRESKGCRVSFPTRSSHDPPFTLVCFNKPLPFFRLRVSLRASSPYSPLSSPRFSNLPRDIYKRIVSGGEERRCVNTCLICRREKNRGKGGNLGILEKDSLWKEIRFPKFSIRFRIIIKFDLYLFLDIVEIM